MFLKPVKDTTPVYLKSIDCYFDTKKWKPAKMTKADSNYLKKFYPNFK